VPFLQGSLSTYKLHNFRNKDAYGLQSGKSENTSNRIFLRKDSCIYKPQGVITQEATCERRLLPGFLISHMINLSHYNKMLSLFSHNFHFRE